MNVRRVWLLGIVPGAIVAVVTIAVGSGIVTATGVGIIVTFGGRYPLARSRYQTGSRSGPIDHEAAGSKEMHL